VDKCFVEFSVSVHGSVVALGAKICSASVSKTVLRTQIDSGAPR